MNRPLRPNQQASAAVRKPRILVAGEFSAGKTQLITGLLDAPVLPSNVTSTALPPVWLVSGETTHLLVGHDRSTARVTCASMFELATTRYGVIAHEAPVLQAMDIIDTPGNSDPNIPPETWQQMLDFADAVVWCSNATQAWRQSEKSVWQDMPEHLRRNATLLVTHADRLPDQRTADRLMRRIQREAAEFFDHILLVSLLNPGDLTRIAAHLTDLAQGLKERPGAANPLVSDLSDEVRLTTASPRAPKAPVSTTSPASPAPKAAPRRVHTSPKGAEIGGVPQASQGRAPAAGIVPQGPVRKLWQRLGGGSMADEREVLLARIDQLITLLDDRAGDRAADRGRQRPQASPPQATPFQASLPSQTERPAHPAASGRDVTSK